MADPKDNGSKDSNVNDSEEQLWQFPCQFMFKAMANAVDGVEDEIVAVIQQHIPGDYSPKVKPSKTGKYVSVTVSFTATSKAQLDAIYLDVNKLNDVKFCL